MRFDVDHVVLRVGDDRHIALVQGRMFENGKSGLVLDPRRLDLGGQISVHHLLTNLRRDVVLEQIDFAAFGKRTRKTEQGTKQLLLRKLRTLAHRPGSLDEINVHHGLHGNTPLFASTLELDGVLVRLGDRIEVWI